MSGHTSMLHVRVNDKLKAEATANLANFGLTVSDAVRILLTRITKEGGLPACLFADPEPAHVLLSFEHYLQLAKQKRNIADALAMPGAADIDFELERALVFSKQADLS